MSRHKPAPTIVLFRRDLRIDDNGALAAAVDRGAPVIALYILDDEDRNLRAMGAASRWWLHHSLAALDHRLRQTGANLLLARGRTDDIVGKAIGASSADCVFWNRRYDPSEAPVDARLKADLREKGLTARSFDGALLHEPSLLKTGAGGFYRVYTPFWKAMVDKADLRDPIDAPGSIDGWVGEFAGLRLNDLNLLPTKPDWAQGLRESWTPGEEGGKARLDEFIEHDLEDYERRRDIPGERATSRLSPHLAFGEITPFQILASLRKSRSAGASKFRSEIGWREFSYHLLFHNPDLAGRNFRPEFDAMSWRDDAGAVRAWQRGLTGYPIVDAGMRELWRTGWMHNRVRMIAASFLIKDLMIDWRHGEKWFWDTLVDADAANNPASWQWVAGSGADAAPYFRIFNPVLQGEKLDPQGSYVRRHIPEIAALPDRYIHRPWEAPASLLKGNNIELGKTYPKPIVDHGAARDRALIVYQSIKDEKAS
ncbi:MULTISPECIES: deoxyribodipyrimidine photo-lyase [unclassified Mesorhizobium]|uniref:cryptochrome/photolyase family protein n=1 Tax=unclassified Mesorhizobium TaxID=325217 RepID=UPI000967C099|nr:MULTISPECIES: deoxyribodipyrimidine photo-lyase [unclassified Mesorhizobium]MBN9255104.1 deoxyribodipyrimidine photo-lyase [Mesorhizobium sp.]OJX76000.1 MAG: deoxyribodipyrimidine photolyase [Mesorhizobium sp. 65-26]